MVAVPTTKPYEIPFFDFGGDDEAAGGGGERWRELCDKVQEACETHGCFCVLTDTIPAELREGMVEGLRQLFDLPVEVKERHVNPKPFHSYMGKNDVVPHLESFGIGHAPKVEEAQAFTQLMWPHGNPSFCEALNGMSIKLLELNLHVMKMIFTSYGLDTDALYQSYVANTASNFRLMKYNVPPPAAQQAAAEIGLLAHTDKNAITVIGQNDVQGLEIQTRDGEWVPVTIPDGAYIVIVGDTLKAWSNGRLHAVVHRVVTNGEKVRLSWGSFLMPKDDSMVEVPQGLVVKEHPLMYRPFTYAEFFSYFVSKLSEDALEVYAGCSSPAVGIA